MNPQNQSSSGQSPLPMDPQNSQLPPITPLNGSVQPLGGQPMPPMQNGTGLPYQPPLMPQSLTPIGSQPTPPTQPPMPPRQNRPPLPEPTDPKDQVIESIKQATNVLVTVSNDPSVDQLAAAIGFTLVLNKLDKHATAVFSGNTPSTIEFLQPSKTLERNTDSLRDFIIALDKSKADKLRYKIEDKFVKIFITPYHTSLSQKDLEFSQGDFNVDVVIALGVQQKEQLDQAITAHGRILHDATVISINNTRPGADLGLINWYLPTASSLSEIMVGVSEVIDGEKNVFDSQIATAFLTGIVAETNRFSNDKTSPVTMNTAAKLMDAGANQQLVATKLAEPAPIPKDTSASINLGGQATQKGKSNTKAKNNVLPEPVKSENGSLQVPHLKESIPKTKTLKEIEDIISEDNEDEEEDDLDKIHIDEQGTLSRLEEMESQQKREETKEMEANSSNPNTLDYPSQSNNLPSMILTPPTMGGALSANTRPEGLEPSGDPLSLPYSQHGSLLPGSSTSNNLTPLTEDIHDDTTLSELEEAVDSPHIAKNKVADNTVDEARQEVGQASSNGSQPLEPIAALNAQPVDLDLRQSNSGGNQSVDTLPPQLVGPDMGLPADQTGSSGPITPPPPVPPPITPILPTPSPYDQNDTNSPPAAL